MERDLLHSRQTKVYVREVGVKVALIFPRIVEGWWSPALFAGYIGASLEAGGHKVFLIDLTFHPKDPWGYLRERLRMAEPDFIGVHSQTVFYDDVLRACEIAREEFPCVPLIVGGPHACLKPEQTLKDTNADYVVVGEGEYVFREIVDGKRDRGVIHAEPIEDLDGLPFPARHLFDKEYERSYVIPVVASRGCPFKCSFCYPGVPAIFGERVRYRSPRNVVEEIKQVHRDYPRKTIRFNDDTSATNRGWMTEFSSLIICEGVKVAWESKTRVNLVDMELVKLMKRAGCVRLEMGVESGSDRVRNEILNKSISREQILNAFRVCRDVGVESLAFFMIASPTETPAEIGETIQLMKEIKAGRYEVTILNPMPMTDIYGMAERENLIVPCSSKSTFKVASIRNPYYTKDDLEFFREIMEKGMNGRSMWTDRRIMLRQFNIKRPITFIRPLYYLLWWIMLEFFESVIVNQEEVIEDGQPIRTRY